MIFLQQTGRAIDTIMRHYLVLNRAMADAAIGKPVACMEQEGIAI